MQQPQIELINLDKPKMSIASALLSKKSEKKNQRKSRFSRFSRISKLSVHDLKTGLFYIRESWRSGMATTFLIMPFALNAGNNSGLNASIGLTSAFIGSFVNGLFSGSNHSIYVPNQMAALFNYNIIEQYGVEAVPWVTLMIGIIIYICGLFKWHHLIEFMPSYVIEGYFWGLGFLIINNYIDYGFGLSDLQSNRGVQVYEDRFEMYKSYFQRGNLQHLCATIGVFLFLYIGNKVHKPFPWVIVSTFIGIFIGQFYPNERCLRSVYGDVTLTFNWIETYGEIFQIDFKILYKLFQEAIPMALYIMTQNLICAKGAEILINVKCDYDQEIECVSVCNILSGLLGGIPCNAQQRLYVLNIKVKEVNRWSSILNSFSILIFYGLLGKYFMEIPLFIIGGQVLYSGYQCPTWSFYDRVLATRRYRTILKVVALATLSVYYGPIPASLIGSLYALLKFAETMSAAASEIVLKQGVQSVKLRHSMTRQQDGEDEQRVQVDVENDLLDDINTEYIIYRFNGSLNYINAKNHVEQIKRLPEIDTIVFSFRYVSVLDEQALDRLSVIMDNLLKSGRELYFTGLHEQMIEQMKFNQFFKDFIEIKSQNLKFLGK
ncbi:unnamed protein product [Paramecium pentaurelia]|uniref:STAS domain-containing protein n=1 Tax=Paramecium pentaurelia TaxID=43138 RepID=A0A8S1TTR0_9CILI|nr:unnamed protein product [Paramecium pentaurelia]